MKMEKLTDDIKKQVFAYLLKDELEHHHEIDMWRKRIDRKT